MAKLAITDHPVNELISRRWSPKAFSNREIADSQLRSLFEAARWAASSFNEQPWAFVIARKQDEE
ncbi:MAG: nitroreductase family protein, partial [Nitrospira sp.]|nr:nitroreductase family protein [Nitrospira sp.]